MAQRQRLKGGTSQQPRHVLLADDGSKAAARARAFALMLAAASGARLTAAYVRQPAESLAEADRKFTAVRRAAAATGMDLTTVVEPPVGITNAGRRIVSAARRHRADVIVLGARGSGLVHKLLGSVSGYVVSHAPMSVSVVR